MVTVSISEQIVDHIEDMVDSGRFANANDVLQAALEALDERLRIEEIRAAIAEADEEFERGEFDEVASDFVERIGENVRVRAAAASSDH